MILCVDLSTGASGDKLFGALLEIAEDTGLFSLEMLQELAREMLPDTAIIHSRVSRDGIKASSILIQDRAPQPHRHWSDIRKLIEGADLTPGAKTRSLDAFQRIAEAEARVHDVPVEDVHFHEVGASDSILDIVCCSVLLDALDAEDVYATPLALGSGTVECAHGRLPVPAPATAELVKDLPVCNGDVESELTTPTGAALIAANVTSFDKPPIYLPMAYGYGAGCKDFPQVPNIVRIIAARSCDKQE